MSTLGTGGWLQRNWRKLILAAIAAVLMHSLYLHHREEQRYALLSELLCENSRYVKVDTEPRDYRLPPWVQRLPVHVPRYGHRCEVQRIVFAADDPPELIDRTRRVFREAVIERAAVLPSQALPQAPE